MSTKQTLILTDDDEHWYSDCSEALSESEDAITIEFNKKNIRIDVNDDNCIILTIINPNCELYKLIMAI